MTTRVIMLIAMVTCLSMTAEAADETLPLAWQGTVTETMMDEEKKPEPISMGIIVNFTNTTVQGFGNPDPNEDFPIKITEVNEATISFQGKRPDNPESSHRPEDRRHHRPRDRRCECYRYPDEPESEQDRIFDTLRAEMQANATDVLVNGSCISRHTANLRALGTEVIVRRRWRRSQRAGGGSEG